VSMAIRVETHGLTLAWARCPDVAEEPPPVAELDGHTIRWDDWEVAPLITHIVHECERCGYDGQPWIVTGCMMPLPGETVASYRPRKLRSGRTYDKACLVPAWPIRRLFAYRCPACRCDTVYDMGPDMKGWKVLVDATGQDVLF
jgi:hypothetical protein